MLYTRGNNEEAFTQTIIQRDVVTHNCAMSERLLHTPCGHRLVKQSEAICKGHWKGHLVTLQDCARSDEGHTIDILYGHTSPLTKLVQSLLAVRQTWSHVTGIT